MDQFLNTECPCCLEKFIGTFHPNLSIEHYASMFIAVEKKQNWFRCDFVDKPHNTIYFILQILPNNLYPSTSPMHTLDNRMCFLSFNDINKLFNQNIINIVNSVTQRMNTSYINRIGKCNHAICISCTEKLNSNSCPLCRCENYLFPFYIIPKENETISRETTPRENEYPEVNTYTFAQLLNNNSWFAMGPENSSDESDHLERSVDESDESNESHDLRGTLFDESNDDIQREVEIDEVDVEDEGIISSYRLW